MLKQNDAVIIFVILAAVIGVLILSSNTASLVLVGALAMIFGGLIGVRLRKSRASEDEKEKAEVVIKEEAAQPSTQASSTVETRSELEPDTAVQVAEGAMSPSVPTTVARPQSRGETAAPSQVALLKNLVASVSEGITTGSRFTTTDSSPEVGRNFTVRATRPATTTRRIVPMRGPLDLLDEIMERTSFTGREQETAFLM